MLRSISLPALAEPPTSPQRAASRGLGHSLSPTSWADHHTSPQHVVSRGLRQPSTPTSWTTYDVQELRFKLYLEFKNTDLTPVVDSALRGAAATGKLDLLAETLAVVEEFRTRRKFPFGRRQVLQEAMWLLDIGERLRDDCRTALEAEDEVAIRRAIRGLQLITGREANPGHSRTLQLGMGFWSEPEIAMAVAWFEQRREWNAMSEADGRLVSTVKREAKILLLRLCDLQRDLSSVGLSPTPAKLAAADCREALLGWATGGMQKFLQGLSIGTEPGSGGDKPGQHLGGFLGLEAWDDQRSFLASAREWHGVAGVMGKVSDIVTRLLVGLQERADARDQRVLRRSLWQTPVSVVTQPAPSGADVLQVPGDCPFRPGDDIVIGGEYNRVRSMGSIHLVARLLRATRQGAKLSRLVLAPVVPVKGADDGKTQAFVDEVEALASNPKSPRWQSTDDVLVGFGLDPLPDDAAARKREVLRLYTGSLLYGEVNKAMYTNDRAKLREYASYILELRDVFRFGQEEPIVEPFSGDVIRGLELNATQLASYVTRLSLGRALCWSSFTSTSHSEEVKGAFDKNTVLKVSCFKLAQPGPGEYFPAKISHYSIFKSEDEVLFPPHTSLRFVNIKKVPGDDCGSAKTVIELETIGYPCVWDLISEERWQEFEEWADGNSEMVDCRDREYSILCAVAAAISKPPAACEPDPIEVCVRHGANVNEVDKHTWLTALATLAQNHVDPNGGKVGGLQEVIKSFLSQGASPYLKTEGSQSAADILGPMAQSHRDLMKFKWQYWVDDGVDGKKTAWHDWQEDASAAVEEQFQQWLESQCSDFATMLAVRSGHFSYDVDFGSMHQVNTRYTTRRRIRRVPIDDRNADLAAEAPALVEMLERVLCEGCRVSAEAVCGLVPEGEEKVHELFAELSATEGADALLGVVERFAKAAAKAGGTQQSEQSAAQLRLALEELEQTRAAAKAVAGGACKRPQESGLMLEASRSLTEERYLSKADPGGHAADSTMAMAMCLEVQTRGGRTNAALHWCLSWDNQLGQPTDLDAHLRCPTCGREVYFGIRACDCGRVELDQDDTGRYGGGQSIENMFVLDAVPAMYSLWVDRYAGPPVPFLLAVRSFGKLQRLFRMGAQIESGTTSLPMRWTGQGLELLDGPEGSEPELLAPPIGYSATVGFVAVDAEAAVAAAEHGCEVSKVGLGFSPGECIKAFLRGSGGGDGPRDIVLLELRGLPECLLDRPGCTFAEPFIDPKYLLLGVVNDLDRKHEGEDYLEAPCPYCGESVSRTGELEGRVGLWRFWDEAFMTSPCSSAECVRRMKERQRRLDEGESLHLYHQTSPQIAAAIRASGKMIRGGGGIVGGGIYFAESPRETEWKWEAHHGQCGKEDGVVLECAVRVGRRRNLDRFSEDPSLTFARMVAHGDYDSVYMDRGVCQVSGPAFGKPAGNEVIVYSWDQVSVLGEVPRDPVPQGSA